MKLDWNHIAKELKATGAQDYEIEEARLSFEQGIRLLMKMYFDDETKHLSSKVAEGKPCQEDYKKAA